MAKRVFDIAVAVTGLVVSAPIVLVVAAVIRVTMGAPVFFKQVRPGHKARPFTMVKFRTMNNAVNTEGELLPDAERLTAVGRFLRSTSLDELPQLWNVLKGEMSIVGPRPLLLEYLEAYTAEQARRHDVRPGITGWAQVCGRQDIPFSRRLALDVWYVDHHSFWLDMKIIALTALRVAKSAGVQPGQEVADVDDLGLHPSTRGRSLDD